jgi:dTDP-4-amino-4,6-dideoxygalactose transaminase
MDDVLAIARTRGLKVIEDCALSLLSSDGVKPLGTRADASIFCLYKSLPVPHGGALWMPQGWDGEELEPAGTGATLHQLASSMLGSAARAGRWAERLTLAVREGAALARRVVKLPVDGAPVGTRRFVPGEEQRGVSPVVLQIARALEMRDIVEQRRRNYYALLARLRDVSPPLVHELGPGVCPLFYPLWCEEKPLVRARLLRAGIESIDFWNAGSPLVEKGAFPEVEALRRHVLELPVHQDLDQADMEAMAAAVREALGAGVRHAP